MNAIEVKNISKEYGTKKKIHVVKNVSFSVTVGSVFGFIGPNGAGKTSTIKMIVGLSHPTSGAVTVFNESPFSLAVKKRLGFMPESPQFYQYLTGEEFLLMVAELFSIESTKEKVKQLLKEVDLAHGAHKRIRTYSKGMLQRLGLAQAMLNDPDLLLLDEPLDGLDPLGRAEVKKIIKNLKEKGKTIFINTHILGDVEEICDTVAIIDQGELLTTGSPKEISLGYKDLESAFVDIITKKRALPSKV
ncbi:MAG: ABC transporter ATP-binding protein [Candidatus Pacebacteria bacterium]|nr:ABC transporter ATP-binding protein [Candidatus Paceibacterota bacterium]